MQTKRFKKTLALGLATLLAAGSITMAPTAEVSAAAKAPTKITLNASKKTVEVGKSFTLKVKSVTPKTASKSVTFKTSNKKVASVTSKGVVTGVKAGKAKITVASAAKKSVKAVCSVTVTAPKAKSITVADAVDKTLVVGVKKTLTVKPSALPEGAKVSGYTYSIKDKKIATVDKKGKLKGVKAGKTALTIKSKKTAGIKTLSLKLTVIVPSVPVTGVSLDQSGLNLAAGEEAILKAAVAPENATSKLLRWSSSNAGVAAVDEDGTVEAVAPGTAVITVKTLDGNKTAKCTVTVTEEAGSEAPGTSQTPGTSEAPGTSQAPGTSETPGTSQTPGSSETPGTSQTPGSSETPGTSETTGSSQTPGSSESTGTSQTPGSSESTGTSQTPGSSETPGSSQTTPGSSETPGSSQTPGSSEAADPDGVVHDDYYYWQTFAGVTDASSVASSANAQDQLIIGKDTAHGSYLSFDFSSTNTNDRGAVVNFAGADVSAVEKYIVEFDMAIKPGSDHATQFAVTGTGAAYAGGNMNNGIASNYLLKAVNGKGGSTDYKLNDVQDVAIPSAEWCHYKLYVDKTAGLMSVTITGASGTIADKAVMSYNGDGNVAGLYLLGARYYPVESVDNIAVRAVEDTDEFGDLPEETLVSVEFSSALNQAIAQPAPGTPVHLPVTVKVNGSLGHDLADDAAVEWKVVGLDGEDGYISLTDKEGTGEGTEGDPATGKTAYFNVRNGVSNWIGYVEANVTYKGESHTIRTPFAVIGAGSQKETQLAPKAGYPVDMGGYKDSLVGYTATAADIKAQDLVLNSWSIYGSNADRSLKLVEDDEGVKSLEFASNGGSGSTVGVYQWADQSSQYVIDFTAKFPNGMTFGVYQNTPNNGETPGKENQWPKPEWAATFASGTLTAGTETIGSIDAAAWNRYVISADPSINKYSVEVYGPNGAKIGETGEVDMTNPDATQIYFCFMGTWPMYLKSFEAYKPELSAISVASDADVLKVPEKEGDPASTMDFSANLTSTTGVKMTGAVEWSLAEEYAGVEIEPTGTQTAQLKVSAGAAGNVVVVATKDGKAAEKEILLTTSSNVVAFSKSTSSVTIPFDGEESVANEFTARTLDKDGQAISPGEAMEYTLLAKDGVTETTVKGVTLAPDGTLTVEAGASPAVVYVKATNADKLSNKVKVNIHGLSFAFGSQDAAEGFTQVTNTQYTERLGYGFADPSGLEVKEDCVSSTGEYRFKATVPNGNYNVVLDMDAAAVISETVEGIAANAGIRKTGTKSFPVAVCDGVLDLTLSYALDKDGNPVDANAVKTLRSLTITQAAKKEALAKPAVYAIGDSTTNNSADGAKSWGNCVTDQDVARPDCFSAFSNNGMAGRDSVNYYNEGRVEAVLLAVCPGDYVTVNMGINSKESGEPASYYKLLNDYYVEGILQRGGIPVMLTATPIGFSDKVNSYDASTGKFTTNRGDGAHNADLKKIAADRGLNVIDVGAWGQDWMNGLTMEDVAAYNAANGTSHATVLDMVKSWYVDHNHYKQYLGIQIGTYILSELEKIQTAKTAAE